MRIGDLFRNIIGGKQKGCDQEWDNRDRYYRYNNLTESIRHELWLSRWWESIDLPYQPHPEVGLQVIHFRRLDEPKLACYLTHNC